MHISVDVDMHHIYIHKKLGYCKKTAHLCFIWNRKIKQKWFCCVFFPISFILNLVLDFVCISFIGTKKISNTKHLMTFHTKRKFVHTNVIAFTPWMTIKSRIHAIHTTRRSTTFLHCKKLKNNLAIVLSWEDLDLLNLKLLKVLQVFLWS